MKGRGKRLWVRPKREAYFLDKMTEGEWKRRRKEKRGEWKGRRKEKRGEWKRRRKKKEIERKLRKEGRGERKKGPKNTHVYSTSV